MKRFAVDGTKVKAMRQNLERLSTQKELAYAAGVSERLLRRIENGNAELRADACRRLADALGADLNDIVFATRGPRLVSETPARSIAWSRGPELVPRFDTDIASFMQDENRLFELATGNSKIVSEFIVKLNAETAEYAEELLGLLEGVSNDRWLGIEAIDNIAAVRLRRRIRELTVLLKGNDVWLYVTSHLRKLPESHVVIEDGPSRYESQLIIAFGPPGEYGEECLKVKVDHGQPFIVDLSKPL